MTTDIRPPAVTLSAARQAQRAYRVHFKFCRLRFEYCPQCQWHEKAVSAAYWQADADAERMRALDAAREEGIAWA